jgi:transcription elongation factor Elf1
MGGKKKKTKAVEYKKPKFAVPGSWDCPLCGGKGTFHVRMNKKDKHAEAQCRACKMPTPAFVVSMTPLTEKVDVFFKFYDDLVQRDRAALAEMQVEVRPTKMMLRYDDADGGARRAGSGSTAPDDDVMPMEFERVADDDDE